MKLAQANPIVSQAEAPPLLPTDIDSAPAALAEIAQIAIPGTANAIDPWQKALDWLVLGGPIVWILIGLATIALAIVILKVWQFSVVGVDRSKPSRQALAAWHGGDSQEVIAALQARHDPTSQVIVCALQGLSQGFGDEIVREEVQRQANAHLEKLRLLLRPLAFIGTTSPLLGLLGTVIGMIAAFQGIQEAGSQVDPTVLSGGIWAALLTTAVGLGVAIPVSMAHSWLERKLECLAHRIEDAVAVVFTGRLQLNSAISEPVRNVEPSRQQRGAVIGVIDSTGGSGVASA